MTVTRLKSIVKIPADIQGGNGITVDQDGRTVIIELDPTAVPEFSLPFTFADMFYAADSNTISVITPNTTTTQKILTMTGNGSAGAVPSWQELSTTTDPSKVLKIGDTMTGHLFLPTGPAAANAVRKDYVDALAPAEVAAKAVRYDTAQSITAAQRAQARANIFAAPFDAMAENGMQVNGGTEVHQAGSTTTIGTGSVDSYVIDQWRITKDGTSTLSGSQITVAGLTGFAKALRATVTGTQVSISTNSVAFTHPIEGYRFAPARWGTAGAVDVSVCFWARTSVAGTYACRIINGAASAQVQSSFTHGGSSVWEFKTLKFTGITTGTWTTDATTGAAFQIYLAITGGANLVGTNGAIFDITGFVVLPGVDLTETTMAAVMQTRLPMLMRPYGHELTLCKRYYNKLAPGSGPAVGSGYTSSTTNARVFVPIAVPMRVEPTVTFSAGADFGILSVAVTVAASAITATTIQAEGLLVDATVAGATAGQGCILRGVGANAAILMDARM